MGASLAPGRGPPPEANHRRGILPATSGGKGIGYSLAGSVLATLAVLLGVFWLGNSSARLRPSCGPPGRGGSRNPADDLFRRQGAERSGIWELRKGRDKRR